VSGLSRFDQSAPIKNPDSRPSLVSRIHPDFPDHDVQPPRAFRRPGPKKTVKYARPTKQLYFFYTATQSLGALGRDMGWKSKHCPVGNDVFSPMAR